MEEALSKTTSKDRYSQIIQLSLEWISNNININFVVTLYVPIGLLVIKVKMLKYCFKSPSDCYIFYC
jgi:hypothetical protein